MDRSKAITFLNNASSSNLKIDNELIQIIAEYISDNYSKPLTGEQLMKIVTSLMSNPIMLIKAIQKISEDFIRKYNICRLFDSNSSILLYY